jgi:hypothetical protein
MKRLLRGSVLLVVLLACGVSAAIAEPVQEFGVQIKDVKANGRFSVVFTSNSFDTTGAPPPGLTAASVRFAKGIRIKPAFLRPERLCQTGKLRLILLARQTSGFKYPQMLSNLAVTERRLASRLDPASRRIVHTCRQAYVGAGRFVLDARPSFPDVIPGFMHVFLAAPTAKGAIAGFGIVSYYDQNAPIVRNTALLTDQQPGATVNLFNHPTPDGRYGYEMRLLPQNFGRLPFSVAEVRVESKGIVSPSGEFWATLPRCPSSGKLQFKADYSYQTGLSTTNVIQVPCPRFTR